MQTNTNTNTHAAGRPTRRLIAVVATAGLLCLTAIAFAPVAQARKISITHNTSLGPPAATNPIGVNHTLIATVLTSTQNCDDNAPPPTIDPAVGAAVKFEVTSGPNKGLKGSDTTDAQGHATFTYTSADVGTDEIIATPVSLQNYGICNPDGGAALPSKPVTATWIKGSGSGTGREEDPPTGDGVPQIKISDARVTEGNSDLSPATPITFTVSLSQASAVPVTVDYATADATAIAPADYVAAHATLTFNPGDPLTQQVTIDVRGDHWDELDETFTVDLTNAKGAQLVDPQGIGTIMDDDGPSVGL